MIHLTDYKNLKNNIIQCLYYFGETKIVIFQSYRMSYWLSKIQSLNK